MLSGSHSDISVTNFPLLSELRYWITERQAILNRRRAGEKKPWTKDPILQSYRFCNVRREDDTVTIWVRKNWREPYEGHENMAFAMLVARLVNWPATLSALGFPTTVDVNYMDVYFTQVMHRQFTMSDKVFSGAYIVSTNGVAMDKSEYLERYVLTPAFGPLRSMPRTSLEDAYEYLIRLNAVGSFIAGQVIADLKYTSVLRDARDWNYWCAKGPGSMRGLNRVAGHPLGMKWNNQQFVRKLSELRIQLDVEADIEGPLCLQDLQNCLCEFDKYMRTKNGEGRPRSTYPGL